MAPPIFGLIMRLEGVYETRSDSIGTLVVIDRNLNPPDALDRPPQASITGYYGVGGWPA